MKRVNKPSKAVANFDSARVTGGADQLLTRKEAAAVLGVEDTTLAAWHCTKRHYLPVVKVGRLVKYRMSDLQAFIEQHTC